MSQLLMLSPKLPKPKVPIPSGGGGVGGRGRFGSIHDPNVSSCFTSGSRGGPGGPGPRRPPDLEAPVIQFGGPVYNLRAKQ